MTRAHFVFDRKCDDMHKDRLLSDGNLTKITLSSACSGVASRRGIRLVLFLAALNQLQLWVTDASNAYLEAKSKEKVHAIASPEFKELQGHMLVIQKSQHGLRTSGLRCHEILVDFLRDTGLFPCKVEPDMRMKKAYHNIPPHSEYIAVHVDDLLMTSKTPDAIVSLIQDKHDFKLKGASSIAYHLDCDFVRYELHTLCLPLASTLRQYPTSAFLILDLSPTLCIVPL